MEEDADRLIQHVETGEYYNIKSEIEDSLMQESISAIQIENERELMKLHEKNVILQDLVMNQSKLIELQMRLDLVKSAENPDKKELIDLDKKISLFHKIIQENYIKLSEITNNKRRELLSLDSDRKSAIWDNFNQFLDDSGNKYYSCSYCSTEFVGMNFTLAKCKEHLYTKCSEAPPELRSRARMQRIDHSSRATNTNTVWDHFVIVEKDDKIAYKCHFCDKVYSTKNATKCREHLAVKCKHVPHEVRQKFKETFSDEYLTSMAPSKKLSIWEHFVFVNEEADKVVTRCLYCGMNYANKNATKCREHLLDRCERIPLSTRSKLNDSLSDSPSKTWTQIKIPIKNYFSEDGERKIFRCNYCRKEYSTKNVTKFRGHLINKCNQIPATARKQICEYIKGNNSERGGMKRRRRGDDDDEEDEEMEHDEHDEHEEHDDHSHTEPEIIIQHGEVDREDNERLLEIIETTEELE